MIRFRPGAGAAVIAAAALAVTYLVAAPATAAEPPSVTVTPSCGEATTLTFEGRGASPGSSAYVDIDGLQVAYRIPVGADGRWTTTVDLEEPLDVGRHQVATSFAPETLDAPTTTFDLPCAPEIDVRPSRVARRSHAVDVALSGASFVPFRLVELSVAGVAVSSGRPDRDGSISASLPIPPGLPCGPVEVAAQEQVLYGLVIDPSIPAASPALAALPLRRATATVEIACPSVRVSPGTVAQDSLPRSLDWTVEGFDADAQVALRLGDRPVGVVTTDAEGTLRTRRPAAGLPCGDVPVVAEQMAYDDEPPTATSTLTVHCARVAPATLTVDPGVVSRGGAVRALGAKFTPGTKVRLSWLLVGGRTSPQVAEVTVRADGTFATGVLVLTHDEQGTRDLVAVEVVAAGPPPSAATDSVLVVGGSMQPGRRGLVSRR